MNKTEHLDWIDYLRITACVVVVLAHCCDPFVAQFNNNRGDFLTGAFVSSLTRACVPLFVMITGVLLLPLKTDMVTFYKKRIGRLIVPLVFWSIITPIAYTLYLYFNPDVINPNIVLADHSLSAMFVKFYTFIFNFTYETIPLWYLYMLIGLYLAMPMVSAWVSQATKKEIKTVLIIWGVSLLVPYIKMIAPVLGYKGNYGNMGLLGICDWNFFGVFYYVSGFIGYVLLAYYLVKYPIKWSNAKCWAICVPMFIIGYAITSGGFILTQYYYPSNYAELEVVWYFFGINVFMMTFPIFILMQRLKRRSSTIVKRLSALTFGVYLSHFFFTMTYYDIVYPLALPAFVKIIAIAILTFASALIVSWLLSLNKHTRKFIA